jgi:hypothetical protein
MKSLRNCSITVFHRYNVCISNATIDSGGEHMAATGPKVITIIGDNIETISKVTFLESIGGSEDQ